MSDFHKLTVDSSKAPPKRKFYRNYKNFDEDNFNKDLNLKLNCLEKLDYSLFENTFIEMFKQPCSYKN